MADISPDDSQTYIKNSVYWDKEIINGISYDLPFPDTGNYIMSDEAAINCGDSNLQDRHILENPPAGNLPKNPPVGS